MERKKRERGPTRAGQPAGSPRTHENWATRVGWVEGGEYPGWVGSASNPAQPGPTRVNPGHASRIAAANPINPGHLSGIAAAPTHPDHPDACPQTANPTRIRIWAAGWGPSACGCLPHTITPLLKDFFGSGTERAVVMALVVIMLVLIVVLVVALEVVLTVALVMVVLTVVLVVVLVIMVGVLVVVLVEVLVVAMVVAALVVVFAGGICSGIGGIRDGIGGGIGGNIGDGAGVYRWWCW